MKFESKLIAFAGALVIAGSSFAFKTPPTCPSIADIKVEGLSNAEKLMEHLYFGYQISNYKSDMTWIFAAGPFEGDSEEEALEEGNKALRYLSGSPAAEPDQGGWVCLYEMGDHFAVALQSDNLPSPYRMKHYFSKKR
ncbi:hemin binding protein Hbp [Legionella lansingensis]|uniref:Hemin binding protein n=1 Tax=Legionella lansingensis TaxID=45067 RepID=A0A0W0VF79_9GAMM|nr:DUF4949 domain-containing protein [Legionella lansingensis]KTD18738.1 hemin binding protein [Legionella lansingensis]SNV58351.1 hemin binding protein Hbp [Legionella lansingensis]